MEFDNFKAAHINYNKVLAQVLERVEANDLLARINCSRSN